MIFAHTLKPTLAVAPMAGISDKPFRAICRQFGADYAVSEMVTSDLRLWRSRKTRTRIDRDGEPRPHIVQIAGGDVERMVTAAKAVAGTGADVVDINMGCPAKKVCNKAAGSALLRDEHLVAEILQRTVAAVDIPVTLKMRTGWRVDERNGVAIARIAEEAGIQALTVHGRTRACAFRGKAEYDTIAAIKASVAIPVIANGDIADPAHARHVLQHTGADGLMIGRAARGNPWLFAAIKAELESRPFIAPDRDAIFNVMRQHLSGLHDLYGAAAGVRIARKHIGWYLSRFQAARELRAQFNRIESSEQQFTFLAQLERGLASEPAWGQAA